ncbi:hypothetical protein T02_16299 [Trichinella nativa]|uniref:Uncharacterized protein n=1 Tax=Trichinella nativa TaxID=6335 RepID=A0A0V1LJI2_9BILA|nr:hypothetical protein T02_16299 [Trichinella nativa]
MGRFEIIGAFSNVVAVALPVAVDFSHQRLQNLKFTVRLSVCLFSVLWPTVMVQLVLALTLSPSSLIFNDQASKHKPTSYSVNDRQ